MYGIQALEVLANYSQSIPNIINLNFGTSGRILRYNKNQLKEGDFADKVGYIGVLFSAIKLLNSKSKLVPNVNYVVNTIEFVGEKFFDHDAIMALMDDINDVSNQIDRDYDEVYDMFYYEPCK